MKILACCKICKVFLQICKIFQKKFLHDATFFMIFQQIYAVTKLLFSYANPKMEKFYCKKLVKKCKNIFIIADFECYSLS